MSIPGIITPALTQAALDAYVATADFTGICPVVTLQGMRARNRNGGCWRDRSAARSGARAMPRDVQLDRRCRQAGSWPQIDVLLAQKYAGAAGKARRAVKIEWDGVKDLTPLALCPDHRGRA
jgi:hypothetical protein